MSIFIIVDNIDSLGAPLIGEAENEKTVLEQRGTREDRAAWVADELLIASVRLAASRSMPIWIQADSSYCSLAALVLSEYQSAQVAERNVPRPEPDAFLDAPLNLIDSPDSELGDDDWQELYLQTGILSKRRRQLSMVEAMSNHKPSLLICIGQGGAVDHASQLAEQMQISTKNLDFSQEQDRKDRQKNPRDTGLNEKLRQSRNISLYRVEDGNFVEQNRTNIEPQIPPQLKRFPPLPLLVYWQLEEALPPPPG